MRLHADREGASDAATAESFRCKKMCAIFRQLFCAPVRRITGASARANYRVRTRITL